MRILYTVAWLMAVAYSQVPTFWFLAHPLAERWRARRRSAYRVLAPVWVAEMILVAAVTWRWRFVTIYDVRWLWLPAVPLFVAGVWLYREAHRGFTHDQLIGRAELDRNKEQRLVTTGIRARVRHPVYLAHLCELTGWCLGSGLVVCYVLLAYALVGFAIMLPMEDDELERRFGNVYADYRRTTPALIPKFF